MYLSKISLIPEKLNHKQSQILNKADGYGIHQWIWELFSNSQDQKRNFIYRREEGKCFPFFYSVSEIPPKNDLVEWNIQIKEYNPVINHGDRFRFSLRVNPVICHKVDNKSRRDDVVMNLKFQKYKTLPASERPLQSHIEREAGMEWLQRQAKDRGFDFHDEQISVEGYQQHIFYKKQKKINVSTLDFNGILKVTDPTKFKPVLFNGLGHAKAFGCGLMLVRRCK